jgi:heme-degrading monooxygenase HmoA
MALLPYTAVIFTAQRTNNDDGYESMAEAMLSLASQQPGFISIESVEDLEGNEITVSYWRAESDARAWKQVAEHLEAQRRGREQWYRSYTVRVATVEREYAFG